MRASLNALPRACWKALLVGLAAAALATAPRASAQQPARSLDWRSKVNPRILGTPPGEEQELLIVLERQADLSGARRLSTKAEKGRYVFQRLTETARRSQGPLLAELAKRGLSYQSFWITNMVLVRGRGDLVEALARRPDVARVEPNPRVPLRLPPAGTVPSFGRLAEGIEQAESGPEWNLVKVGAPQVWAAGFTGQGVVVAGADTGYDWTHPALKGKYRGWNGTTADHDYNWHDAVHDAGAGNSCGSDAPAPCDDDSHGTHTMGIMVGDDGAGNQIGMAPGARWIGCRNMDQGVGTPARYTECFQWFLAPTDSAGANPDPSRAPDAINNSWDCPPSEGCTDPNTLKSVIESVRAAGIVVVVSAGNQGPGCDSMDVPEKYAAAIDVGATDAADAVADFSSRGPGENGIVKPEIVAPGSGVRSSVPGGGYATQSGTSMSAPHAAGLTALLFSASPGLAGDVDSVETILEQTAIPIPTVETCGGVAAGAVPNNTSGWGRIDAAAALDAARCPPPTPVPDAPVSAPPATGGLAASVTALPAHAYAWTLSGGTITAGQGTSQVTFTSGAPGATMQLSVTDTIAGCASPAGEAAIQVDFLDVPPSHPFHGAVVRIARDGISKGCGGGNYCPSDAITRAQMAVFLLRAIHGGSYKPPAATGAVFGDVPASAFAAAWIEELAAEGITSGCGGGNYCPDAPVTRAGMAVFLLRGVHGAAYKPPAQSGGVFGDVPLGAFLGDWIEELSAEGITSGCGGGNYCPGNAVTRGEMAAFLNRALTLP
ncbi:MAG: S8 family serine peptidase [Acidobacteriota bacterium]